MAAAAGLLVLGIGGWSFRRLAASRPNVGPNQPFIVEQANDLASLDGNMKTGGAAAIRQVLAKGDFKTIALTHRWIADRGHAALYGDVVSALGDPNVDVRTSALSALWSIPATALKPWLAALGGYQAAETDVKLAQNLAKLIVVVTKS